MWEAPTSEWPWNQATILDKMNGKPRPPPPPQIKDGKMARFCPLRTFILDLGGMGVCCSILFCPRLSESLDWRYSQRHDSNHDKKSAFKCFKLNAFKANLVIYQWTHTKQKNCAYLIYMKCIKNSLIISLYEVQDALLTTREFFCVEGEKKTCLCLLIHCNCFYTVNGRTL